MKKFALIIIIYWSYNFKCSAQNHNFSYKFGLASITGSNITTETINYFTLEVDGSHPFNFYPVHGLQYEFRPKNVNRIGLNGEVMTHAHWISPYVSDTHPDLFFSTGGRYIQYFRHLTLSVGPSFHIRRFAKIFVGLDFQYNFRVGDRGYDWQSISSNPNHYHRREWEMADAMYRHLKIKPFAVNAFVAIELRFWRLGFEGRVANPLTGNLLKELRIDGYTWNTQYYVQNIIMLTTKFYLRKV